MHLNPFQVYGVLDSSSKPVSFLHDIAMMNGLVFYHDDVIRVMIYIGTSSSHPVSVIRVAKFFTFAGPAGRKLKKWSTIC